MFQYRRLFAVLSVQIIETILFRKRVLVIEFDEVFWIEREIYDKMSYRYTFQQYSDLQYSTIHCLVVCTWWKMFHKKVVSLKLCAFKLLHYRFLHICSITSPQRTAHAPQCLTLEVVVFVIQGCSGLGGKIVSQRRTTSCKQRRAEV